MNIVKAEQPFLIEAKTISDFIKKKKSISLCFTNQTFEVTQSLSSEL